RSELRERDREQPRYGERAEISAIVLACGTTEKYETERDVAERRQRHGELETETRDQPQYGEDYAGDRAERVGRVDAPDRRFARARPRQRQREHRQRHAREERGGHHDDERDGSRREIEPGVAFGVMRQRVHEKRRPLEGLAVEHQRR